MKTSKTLTRVLAWSILVSGALAGCSFCMPGSSYEAVPPPLSVEEEASRDHLRTHVYMLAKEIGERNLQHYDGLERARDYVAEQFRLAGYVPSMQSFVYHGESFQNVEAILLGHGSPRESVVVGAHYDSVEGSPGANDNASGVATLLEVARSLVGRPLPITVRFVAFTTEEPPYFNAGEGMGSVEYAKALDDPAKDVRAMLSLETVGFYSDVPGSQHYPPFVGIFYPDRGNFIAFVGNVQSRGIVRKAVGAFRAAATLPSEGATLPAFIPGVAWSDHRSFWEFGVPAAMVTDTAPFRDAHYHMATDSPERLDYERMARLVTGLGEVVRALASNGPHPDSVR